MCLTNREQHVACIEIQIHKVPGGRPVRKLGRQRDFGVLDCYMALSIGVCIQEKERLQEATGYWANLPHRARVLKGHLKGHLKGRLKGRLRRVHARPSGLLTELAFRQLLGTLALTLATARTGIACKGRRLSHGSLVGLNEGIRDPRGEAGRGSVQKTWGSLHL